MTTIYKYAIPVTDQFSLSLPGGHRAQILSVQVQRGTPHMWVQVDTEEKAGPRTFRIFGTDHEVHHEDKWLDFVASFQLNGGELVFHLFEVKEPLRT